ncbi:MAG: efflux RND transporter periplasmic adaptor subunit [Chlorobiaceae bacterium]|nr:efflux RND transporter periplasmic adaptor subunit [Chlorobiaceae bacterium]
MKPPSRIQIIAGCGLLLLIALLLLLLRPAPLPVDAGKVSRGPLQVTLEDEGITRVLERFTVSAPVPGRFMRSGLEEGDQVRQGVAVGAILPPSLNTRDYSEGAALAASARANFRAADARGRQVSVNLAQSRLRMERYDNLYREGAISRENWELARNEAEVLEKERLASVSSVQAAAHQMEAAQSRIDVALSGKPFQVISPADGRVLRIHEKSEKVVPAGTPLFDIGDPGSIEIVIDVLSSDAVKVMPGQKVRIEQWGDPVPLHARVVRKEPAAFTKVSALGIEEKRVNIIAHLDSPEPRLGDNFRVQATIVLQEAASVLRVPVSSLFRGQEGWRVFVIDGNRARERKVTTGLRGVYDAEVTGGLREGDRVVLHPANELRDGVRVTAQQK